MRNMTMITAIATAWTILTTTLMAAKVLSACLPITGFIVQSSAPGREDLRTAMCTADVGTASLFVSAWENCTLISLPNLPPGG